MIAAMRIAITGLGIIAPAAIAPIDRFDTAGLAAHAAALVRDFNPRDFIAPMKFRRMNQLSRLTVAAARLALGERNLPAGSGVAIGTAFGTVQTSVDYMQEYVAKGAALAPPQLFAESVANAPGSHVAIEHDLRGFNVTVTQRESSALAAAMYACAQIAKGAAPAALIGGVDGVTEMVFSVLARLGALSDRARPFDRRRDGFTPGEGSAVLVAEALPSKEPLGYFSGFGIGRDTTATISDWGADDARVAEVMRAAMDDAEVERVDAIFASANGSRRGDAVEARAIARVFGDNVPPVVATKGSFGEYAAAGALQLAAAFAALRDQRLPPSVGFEEKDPELPVAPNSGGMAAALHNVLINSISAGGGIVCAVMSASSS
jgi:3-oxoacyl-[acyl-carrier-protein] synthase II